MSTDAARLVDELTTLLYEPLKGTCLTHTPCVIAACGACRKKADKPESVVHDSDCPVYRLQRAEAANTAVIRANAEEIADLEDVRDDLEARVNALTAENARLTQEVDDARAWSARWKAVAKRIWTGVHHPLDMCESEARRREAAEGERDALAVQVAALREAGETLASVVLLLEEDEPVEPTEVRRVALRIQGALDRWRAALAAAGGPV